MDLSGKYVVVTGGAAGLGKAFVDELLARGAKPIVLDIDPTDQETVPFFKVDVNDPGAIAEAATDIEQRLGPIDLLIANAATDITAETHTLTSEDWGRVIGTNLLGVSHMITAIYPSMVARRQGQILIVSSGAAIIGFPMGLPYTASKGALSVMAKALRSEARLHGVKVNLATIPQLANGLCERDLAKPGIDRQAFLSSLPGNAMNTHKAARRILDDACRNRAHIVFPFQQALAYWLLLAIPPLAESVRRNIVAIFHKKGRT